MSEKTGRDAEKTGEDIEIVTNALKSYQCARQTHSKNSYVSKSGVRLFPYYLLAYIMPPLYKR